MPIAPEITILNPATALLLGAAVWFGRQWRQRLAGLRTNTLVALGAASSTVFAASFPGEVSPTRVAAQVVSGSRARRQRRRGRRREPLPGGRRADTWR